MTDLTNILQVLHVHHFTYLINSKMALFEAHISASRRLLYLKYSQLCDALQIPDASMVTGSPVAASDIAMPQCQLLGLWYLRKTV